MPILNFEIDGVAKITSDTDNPNDLPKIEFASGEVCHGLPRHYEEIDEMGYGEGGTALRQFYP